MKSLDITTNIGCINSCIYCPQEQFVNEYKKHSRIMDMSLDSFKAYIKSVPESVQIRFSGFSEPLRNPECVDMIEYASEKGHQIRIYTTLIGLTTEDITRLEKIDFDKFTVHMPDNKNLTQVLVDTQYLELFNRLQKSKINNIHFAIVGKYDIHEKLQEFIDNDLLLELQLINKAGNVEDHEELKGMLKSLSKEGPLQVCEKMYRNNLLPNGDITLCNIDWSLKHIVGNLASQDYKSIFVSQIFLDIVKKLSLPSSDILCRHCTYAKNT